MGGCLLKSVHLFTERLEKLKEFINNSEKKIKGFGFKLREDNIEGHKFLEQTVYPVDFAAFSPKQKRAFIEAFYKGLRIKAPPDSKYFHEKNRRRFLWQ